MISFFFILGLEAIHNVGVIYRDMKLQNVLLSNCGNLMIADFGLAKWLCRRKRTGTICGTLAFMAPEVASGILYDHSIDLWSLGVLLYCLAFAKYPFPKTNSPEKMAENHQENIQIVEKITHENSHVENILKNLLKFQPEERYFCNEDSLNSNCEINRNMTFYDTILSDVE